MNSRRTEELIALIFRVSRLIRERAVSPGAGDVSPLRFEALHFIEERRRPSMREIAGCFRVAAPSATSLIEPMVREGLLARAANPRDRREVRIALTAKGRAALRAHRARKRAFWRSLLSRLTAQERAQFARILRKITSAS